MFFHQTTFVAMLILTTIVSAPSFSAITISPGISIGLNSANATVVSKEQETAISFSEIKSRNCFIGGGFVDIGLNKNLLVSPGVEIAERGFIQSNLLQSEGPSATYAFTYFDVPLMIKADFTLETVDLNFLCGPQIGWLLNARENYPTASGDTTVTIINDVAPIDVGFKLGFGAGFALLKIVPFFQLAVYFGISDISKNDLKIMNKGLEIQIGLKYNLN
jgi:hypothetical protein